MSKDNEVFDRFRACTEEGAAPIFSDQEYVVGMLTAHREQAAVATKALLDIIDSLSYVDESTDPVAVATTTIGELQAICAGLRSDDFERAS